MSVLLILVSTFMNGTPTVANLRRAETAQVGSFDAKNCASQRSLFNIISICLSTTLLCAWVSVHPNTLQGNRWKALWRRIKMMIWTIIAPELILAWSVRQWYGAWTIRDRYTDENTFSGKVGSFDHFIWTGKQWFAERELKSQYESREGPKREWTMTHGHLLVMGGFTLVLDPTSRNPHCNVLTDELFEQLLNDGRIDFPTITVNEIDDKSKSDFLAKAIAILQSTWFILQCIARGIQGLSITELELATLALASLNAITSVFWLRKPLGLQEPVKVNFKSRKKLKNDEDVDEPASPVNPQYENFDFSVARSAARRVFDSIISAISDILRGSCHEHPFRSFFDWCFALPIYILALVLFLPFSLFPFAVVLFLKIIEPLVVSMTKTPTDNRAFLITRIVKFLREIRYRLTSSISSIFCKWLRKIWRHNDSRFLPIPFLSPSPSPMPLRRILFAWFLVLPTLFFALLAIFILLLPPVFIFFSVLFIFTSAFNILASNKVVKGRTHVPAFYAPETTEGRYSRMIVFAFFGVIFGGIHCVGWNFMFPTQTEQNLWRFTSLTITVIPVIVAPIDFFLTMQTVDIVKNLSRFSRVIFSALDLVMTVLIFAYVMARLSLIAQALALLRRQSPDAYLAVEWTLLVPHVM